MSCLKNVPRLGLYGNMSTGKLRPLTCFCSGMGKIKRCWDSFRKGSKKHLSSKTGASDWLITQLGSLYISCWKHNYLTWENQICFKVDFFFFHSNTLFFLNIHSLPASNLGCKIYWFLMILINLWMPISFCNYHSLLFRHDESLHNNCIYGIVFSGKEFGVLSLFLVLLLSQRCFTLWNWFS